MKTYTQAEWFVVVARTAASRLGEQCNDKQHLHKWLAVWSMGLVGEIQETLDAFNNGADDEEFHTECGDVFWYLAANTMLLSGFNTEVYSPQVFPSDCDQELILRSALSVAIARLELVKKIIRDDRPVTPEIIGDLLDCQRSVYLSMLQVCNFDRAIAAVEAKLLKRYPNGYSPEQSINRTV